VSSVHVGKEVGEAYAEALRRGHEIVHPLTEEPWGPQGLRGRPRRQRADIVSHQDTSRVLSRLIVGRETVASNAERSPLPGERFESAPRNGA
jgi:hypothetical protein